MLIGHRLDGFRIKRQNSGKHLVEGDPETVNVAARIKLFSCKLLRAHIGWGPGDIHVLGPFSMFNRQSQIGKLDDAFGGDHDIIRLNVAMDHFRFVPGVVQRLRHLLHDMQRFINGNPAFALNPGFQALTVDIVHCHKEGAVIFADSISLYQVDVGNLRCGSGLA